jgi:tetratricopeptide (TPR) repeat protein
MELAEQQRQLARLETSLKANPNDLTSMLALAELHQVMNAPLKVMTVMEQVFNVYDSKKVSTSGARNEIAIRDGVRIVGLATSFWKQEKYVNKSTAGLRINTSDSRSNLLRQTISVVGTVRKEIVKAAAAPALPTEKDVNEQAIALQLSFLRESLGEYQESLSLLSDLISANAMETGFDLTYIIFRAAVILKHMGANKQAIEYLEFLVDDPPANDGYSKMHILAFLILVYEQSGPEYRIVLEKSYAELQVVYSAHLTDGDAKRPVTNQKKIDNLLSKKPISQSSEIWEMLALQAVDRCDYVLAAELLYLATEKAPSKGKLLHLLAEVYFLLNERENSVKVAERAFETQSNNSELRNLLLTVNPEKWIDRLRTVAVISKDANMTKEEEERRLSAAVKSPMKKSSIESESEVSQQDVGWLAKFKARASETISILHEDGPSGLLSSMGISKTPEQRAREAAEKERRRKERQARKDKKIADAMRREQNDLSRRKKRDPLVDGPARPPKPIYSEESIKLISAVRVSDGSGMHLYDPHLLALANIRQLVEKDEKDGVYRKRK